MRLSVRPGSLLFRCVSGLHVGRLFSAWWGSLVMPRWATQRTGALGMTCLVLLTGLVQVHTQSKTNQAMQTLQALEMRYQQAYHNHQVLALKTQRLVSENQLALRAQTQLAMAAAHRPERVVSRGPSSR